VLNVHGPIATLYCRNESVVGTDWNLSLRSNINGNDTASMYSDNNGATFNRTEAWGMISDRRLKKDIILARDYQEDVCKLKVKKYKFIGSEKNYLGFIAQEVEEVFPGLVADEYDHEYEEDIDDGVEIVDGVETPKTKKVKKKEHVYKAVKTSLMIPMLVSSIQSQQKQITAQQQQISTLENEVASINATLVEILAEISTKTK
jgi:hypothetical protein